VSGHHAILTQDQITSRSDNSGPVSYKGALPDSDCPALGKSLIADWHCDVFIRVVLVHYEDILCDDDIALNMNAILSANLRPPVNDAIIVYYDHWLAIFLRRNTQSQTSVFFYPYIGA
jgi:hypothetical protein